MAARPDRFYEVERVPIRRGDTWLANHGLTEADVDVLRMDVQGAEVDVLRGLPEIDPSVVAIEVHWTYLDADEQAYLKDRLDAWDLVGAYNSSGRTQYPVANVDDLPLDEHMELLLHSG